jgi:hypothetical protein
MHDLPFADPSILISRLVSNMKCVKSSMADVKGTKLQSLRLNVGVFLRKNCGISAHMVDQPCIS